MKHISGSFRRSFLVILISILSVYVYGQREFTFDEELPFKRDGTIHLDTDDARVSIQGTDQPRAHIKIVRKVKTGGISWGDRQGGIAVEVISRDGDLHIREEDASGIRWTIGYSYQEYTVEIEVPASANLRIRGDDDHYMIRGISGSIDMDVDDAAVDIKDCKSRNYILRVDDGDVLLDGARGELFAEIEDGDLIVTESSFLKITAQADDGNIRVETELFDSGEYNFSSDDGDVELSVSEGGGLIELYHDNSRISASSDFELIGREEHQTRYRLGGGDSTVRIRTEDGNVRLRSFKPVN